MQNQGVWILCILALTLLILPGFFDNEKTSIVPCLNKHFDTNFSSHFYEVNFISLNKPLIIPTIPHVYRNSLPGGVDRQWIDLSWNNQNNPHSIVIYPPDTALGPFQNTDDGKLDQRIYLEVSSSSNLTPGIWYYSVEADNTTRDGNESLRIYRKSGDVES